MAVRKLRAGVLGATLVGFLAVGCASTQPPPTTELTEARAAMEQAEEVGAREHAPLLLRSAQKKLEAARAAADKGRAEKARRLSEQASVDARLAGVKARSTKAQEAVQALQESIRALREEIARNQ